MSTSPPDAPRPPRPFRWSPAASPDRGADRLGVLTDGAEPADLWYLNELVACTAEVLARTAAADLCFVGRSLDSMHDLLTGVYEGTSRQTGGLLRLPLSTSGLWGGHMPGRSRQRLREHLASVGLAPCALARRKRPVALIDVVHRGGTFDTLHKELAAWIAQSREPWQVIRRKLRYAGVTIRGRTSPNHWRWQQSESSSWVRTLPAGHVVNVSLDFPVWGWLGNHQPKVNPSFPYGSWFDEQAARVPRHERLPQALAESLALVAAGRERAVRDRIVKGMSAEPGFADRRIRALAREIRAGRAA